MDGATFTPITPSPPHYTVMKQMYRLSLALLMICTLSAAYADKKDSKNDEITGLDLRTWAEEQARILPAEVNGVPMMRPLIEEDRATVSELIDIPGVSKDHIFIAALRFAIEHLDDSEKAIDKIDVVDYDARRFVITRREAFDEGRNACAFKATTAFQCADDMLSFTSYDIEVTYKEKGILPRTRAIEKLTPQKNERHKELFENFSFTNSRYIRDMVEYIREHSALNVTHWNEIKKNEVVRGMNETEVLLSVGVPDLNRASGGKVKWMYGNNFVVIFKDGTVNTVID